MSSMFAFLHFYDTDHLENKNFILHILSFIL